MPWFHDYSSHTIIRYTQKKLFLSSMFIGLMLLIGFSAQATATKQVLTLTFGDKKKVFTHAALLERQDLRKIVAPDDPAYHRQMTFMAVPLPALLDNMPVSDFDTVEAAATDGFLSQLPSALFKQARSGGAIPWVAIEPPSEKMATSAKQGL